MQPLWKSLLTPKEFFPQKFLFHKLRETVVGINTTKIVIQTPSPPSTKKTPINLEKQESW